MHPSSEKCKSVTGGEGREEILDRSTSTPSLPRLRSSRNPSRCSSNKTMGERRRRMSKHERPSLCPMSLRHGTALFIPGYKSMSSQCTYPCMRPCIHPCISPGRADRVCTTPWISSIRAPSHYGRPSQQAMGLSGQTFCWESKEMGSK